MVWGQWWAIFVVLQILPFIHKSSQSFLFLSWALEKGRQASYIPFNDIQKEPVMTASIIQFHQKSEERKKTQMQTSDLTATKVKMIDYFDEQTLAHIQLSPFNDKCPYETKLLQLCQLLALPKTQDNVHQLAEWLFATDMSNLSLKGFIETVKSDDLLLACFQVEFSTLSSLDQLFLINVIKVKFPKEEAAIELMKTLLFAKKQFSMHLSQGKQQS